MRSREGESGVGSRELGRKFLREKKNKREITPAAPGVGSREQNMDAAPGLPGRSPIPVLFQPKGA